MELPRKNHPRPRTRHPGPVRPGPCRPDCFTPQTAEVAKNLCRETLHSTPAQVFTRLLRYITPRHIYQTTQFILVFLPRPRNITLQKITPDRKSTRLNSSH